MTSQDQDEEMQNTVSEEETETEDIEQDQRLAVARQILGRLKQQIEVLEALLEEREDAVDVEAWLAEQADAEMIESPIQGRMVEGVFDGEGMVGEDGRKYAVPPNYASKSKLVEGDLLRLTISGNGRFIFKQRGPIDRQRVVGLLVQDESTQDWRVLANGTKYRVLPASVSYFQGEAGDEAVILIPRNTPSRWAAIENVVKKEGADEDFSFV